MYKNAICWIRAVTIECNYKESDNKLNDQFINELNDSDMLAEIIRELIKPNENMMIPSEQVLCKKNCTPKCPGNSYSLSEVKEFDEIYPRQSQQNRIKLHAAIKLPTGKCKYCSLSHLPSCCLAYGKKCTKYTKMKHFRKVCKSARGSMVQNIEQEANQEQITLKRWISIIYIFMPIIP